MLAIQAGTTDITSSPIMECYNNNANKAVCMQSVSSNVFNIVDDSISNPSLLTDLKNSSYKVSFVPSYIDLLLPQAWAAGHGEPDDPGIGPVAPPDDPIGEPSCSDCGGYTY